MMMCKRLYDLLQCRGGEVLGTWKGCNVCVCVCVCVCACYKGQGYIVKG